jgi:hypothetical protein
VDGASGTLGVWHLSGPARWLGSLTAVVSAACLATLLVTGLALTVHGSPMWAVVALVAAPIVYVLLVSAVNIWRARLVITTDEVIVAGVTRTHRVSLAEVEGFEPRVVHSGVGANGTPTIVLVRRTGAPIGIYALKREGFRWNFRRMLKGLESEAAELNATLAKARAAAD